jgi:hypothetical protein
MTFIEQIKYWLQTEKSGLSKLSKDIRDLHLKDIFGLDPYTPKFKTKHLGPEYPKDQLQHSNCSFQAWAAVYGAYYGGKISARWLNAKAFQQGLCSEGGEADLRAGGKVGQKYGVLFESELPSDETLPWDEYVNIDFAKYDAMAANRKIGSYYKITTVDELLYAIDNDYAVAVGRMWLTGMNQGGGFKAPWILPRTGLQVGGHATAAMGYDMDKGTDIELNSYSEQWGDKGHFYCPLTDLQKDFNTYGAYAITPIQYTPKEVEIGRLQKIVELLKKVLDLTAILENLKKKK